MKKTLIFSLLLVFMLSGVTFAEGALVTNSYFTEATTSYNGFPQPTNVINYLGGEYFLVQNIFLEKGEHEFYIVVYDENFNSIDETGKIRAYADRDQYPYTLTWKFKWYNTSKYTGQMARFVLYNTYDEKVDEVFGIIN